MQFNTSGKWKHKSFYNVVIILVNLGIKTNLTLHYYIPRLQKQNCVMVVDIHSRCALVLQDKQYLFSNVFNVVQMLQFINATSLQYHLFL